jgi:hypothetical protein
MNIPKMAGKMNWLTPGALDIAFLLLRVQAMFLVKTCLAVTD